MPRPDASLAARHDALSMRFRGAVTALMTGLGVGLLLTACSPSAATWAPSGQIAICDGISAKIDVQQNSAHAQLSVQWGLDSGTSAGTLVTISSAHTTQMPDGTTQAIGLNEISRLASLAEPDKSQNPIDLSGTLILGARPLAQAPSSASFNLKGTDTHGETLTARGTFSCAPTTAPARP